MVFSVQQIKYEFLAYMKGLGGEFGDWYVGVASDPTASLFQEHGVDQAVDPWIYKPALTPRAAKTVLKYFVEVLRTDGDSPNLEPEGASFAYAFRKTERTRPATTSSHGNMMTG